MSTFISTQPNGLFCSFSIDANCPVAWNMTREEYIQMCINEAKKEAGDKLDNCYCSHAELTEHFKTNNMTRGGFIQICANVAKNSAKYKIDHARSFQDVIDLFIPNNIREEEFAEFLKETKDEA